jgi:hypothetical protein
LQPIDRHALIEPARHRVDIERLDGVERYALLVEDPEAVEGLVAICSEADD